jgi:hypothetical protein
MAFQFLYFAQARIFLREGMELIQDRFTPESVEEFQDWLDGISELEDRVGEDVRADGLAAMNALLADAGHPDFELSIRNGVRQGHSAPMYQAGLSPKSGVGPSPSDAGCVAKREKKFFRISREDTQY